MTTFETIAVFIFGVLVLVGLPVLFLFLERIGHDEPVAQEPKDLTRREKSILIATIVGFGMANLIAASRIGDSEVGTVILVAADVIFFWGLLFYGVETDRRMHGQPRDLGRSARTATLALIGFVLFILLLAGVFSAMDLGPNDVHG